MMRPLLTVLLAYLLGSIPFGYLVVRSAGRGDVREIGSGGTGATNVTRRAGKWAGLLTLALDAAKGAAAVWLARALLAPEAGIDWWVATAAHAALVGHCFPVWLRFRGGKGVATGLGVFLVLAPLAVATAAAVFLLVVWRTRFVSLGSILASLVLPLGAWFWSGHAGRDTPAQTTPLVAAALATAALIVLMHRANLGRLARGQESKLKLWTGRVRVGD